LRVNGEASDIQEMDEFDEADDIAEARQLAIDRKKNRLSRKVAEAEDNPEIDTRAWMGRMLGRRLKLPQFQRERVSLPEFLASSTKNVEDRRAPRLPKASVPRKAKGPAATTKGFQQVQPSDTEPSKSDNPALRPISRDLARRRELHPRLRWPRLQTPLADPVPSRLGSAVTRFTSSATSSTCVIDDLFAPQPDSTGIVRSHYKELHGEDSEDLGDDFETFLRTAIEEEEEQQNSTVFGEGSVFFGSDDTLAWPWPPFGQPSPSITKAPGDLWLTSARHSLELSQRLSRASLKPLTAASSLDTLGFGNIPVSASSSSAFLHRSKPHEGPVTGSTSTLHNSGTSIVLPSAPQEHAGVHGFGRSMTESMHASGSSPREEVSMNVPVVEDEKWFLRQAPVSCLMARTARTPCNGALQPLASPAGGHAGSGGEHLFLDFESWGVDDAYLASILATAIPADLSRIRRLNMSNNRLTEKSAGMLMSSASTLSNLKSINLSGNQLGAAGCVGIATFLQAARPKLADLDLAGNAIGDQACVELCETMSRFIRSLKVLSLANNNLGISSSGGVALGAFVSGLPELSALDIHWNHFHGAGALALCEGLYGNSCTIKGKLRRLDLSWNKLGLECKDCQRLGSEQVSLCHCPVCRSTRRIAKMMASLFEEGKVLFHLDLSYNSLSCAFCSILADGLRRNHTLFGIHLMGNAASVDDLGFIVPRQDTVPIAKGAEGWQDVEYENQVNDLVRAVPRKLENHWKKKEGGHQALEARTAAWTSVQRNVDRCWICENWSSHDITYIPGYSGSEECPDDVTSVNCFFSVDGFQKPTVLKRSEETFMDSQRLFRKIEQRAKIQRKTGANARGTIKDQAPRLANGNIIVFSGSRVLPPSLESVDVVFQVNGAMVVARDLPMRKLDCDHMFVKDPSMDIAGNGRSPSKSNTITTLSGAVDSNEPPVVKVTKVNVLKVLSSSAVGNLCALEDPSRCGDVSVYPRRAFNEDLAPPIGTWSFEDSSFRSFARDTEELSTECFDNDWYLSKVSHFIKDPKQQERVMNCIRPKYQQIMAIYHQTAFAIYHPEASKAVCLSMVGLRTVLQNYDIPHPDSKVKERGWMFDGRSDNRHSLSLADVDTIFVISNVVASEDEDEKKRLVRALPQLGLARFQFLEAFVRCLSRRFYENHEVEDLAEAIQTYFALTHCGEDCVEIRRSLHACLMIEECCVVYKENSAMLEVVYEKYKKVNMCYPGREGNFTYGAWLKLLDDAEAAECGITPQSYGRAFAIGKELRLDEAESYRHMELSLSEFYVCLGAVVRLRSDFDRDFFADMLADFFLQNVSAALHKIQGETIGPASLNTDTDKSVTNVIRLVTEIFEDADDDHSGTLTVREFRRCLNQPKIMAKIVEAGIDTGDFNVLFQQIDTDRSGEITCEEFCTGMVKMKMMMKGMTRIVAYLRRVFSEKDLDGSGTLDMEEFKELVSDPKVVNKLATLSINVDEIENLFEDMVAECSDNAQNDPDAPKGVTADSLIGVFLRMRDPDLGSKRGLNFLRQIFVEADVDKSSSLTTEEYETAFTTNRVSKRLRKLNLRVPNWMDIFEGLDFDGDGELTLDELMQGLKTIWDSDMEQNIREQILTHQNTKML